jgi:hypothetical protein
MKKNTVISPVIVELGTATMLTMGGCSDSLENYRPAPKYK